MCLLIWAIKTAPEFLCAKEKTYSGEACEEIIIEKKQGQG